MLTGIDEASQLTLTYGKPQPTVWNVDQLISGSTLVTLANFPVCAVSITNLFRKYDMLLCICTSCVTLIDALSTWHHTQIMSLLDYFSKESQGDLVVLSRVPDLKFMSVSVCITFWKYSLTYCTPPHTHYTDPLPFSTHLPKHRHIHASTSTHTTYTPTHIHTHTYIPLSSGDCLCSCCFPVDSLSCSNPSHHNTTVPVITLI